MAAGEYQFLSWIRSGIGAVFEGAPAVVTLDLGDAGSSTRLVAPCGPGDVVGFDSGAVIRSVPNPGVSDFEPSCFASVELEHPAFPWLLSPPPDSRGRVTPWIVLVVVERRTGVSLTREADGRERLAITPPASPAVELPALDQAWAWAHAQAVGPTAAPIDLERLASASGESRSRLIAPRRLHPQTSYFACIVPTFAAGLVAGHGESDNVGGLAWRGDEASLLLPVYHSWSFATGVSGDFASLVRLIKPDALEPDSGAYEVSLASPGWGMPPAPEPLEVTGPLRSPAWVPSPPTAGAIALGEAILGAIDEAASSVEDQVPVLAPPFYGALASGTERTADSPAWQDALNRQVTQRIAAGLGAQVVRADQEAFVDAAWNAAADAELANQQLRQAQLAATLNTRLLRRHVAALGDDGELVTLARPVLSRVRLEQPTVRAAIASSAMPDAALSAAYRRLGRANGPVRRRIPHLTFGRLLERIDRGAVAPVPAPTLSADVGVFDAVSRELHVAARFDDANERAVAAAADFWTRGGDRRDTLSMRRRRRTEIPAEERGRTMTPISDALSVDRTPIDDFAAAARLHQAYVITRLREVSPEPRTPLGDPLAPRPLASLRATIEEHLSPARGVARLVAARLEGVAPEQAFRFEPLKITPVLERPLVDALQRLSPEQVMPKVGRLGANTAALAESAPEVVRAFLVGANEELGRELLWRGFPGAVGHTYLRTFWGRTSIDADNRPTLEADIPPIEDWPDTGPAPVPATVVLLVRAEVLQRYPNAVVYAAPASWQENHRVVGDGEPVAPVVATNLGPGIALFGFDLGEQEVRGGSAPPSPAGYYFVIAEHPCEPRFGLSAARAPGDLAWSSLEPGDLDGDWLRVDGPLGGHGPASDSARVAAITFRRPVRVAMHASTLMLDPP